MSEIELISQIERVSAFVVTVYILYKLFMKQSERIDTLINVIVKKENCDDDEHEA